MRQYIVVFFFFTTVLFGASSESKIIKLIFTSLFEKSNVSVYVTDLKKSNVIKEAGFLSVEFCKEADIVYRTNMLQECKNKPLFTDSYQSFQNEENAIGAFYWKKGRPNILFLQSRVQKFRLKMAKNLEKYQMESL